MMNDLANGPAAITVGRIELRIVEPAHGSAQVRWTGFDLPNAFGALLRGRGATIPLKLADGVSRIHGR
jgi:hypothetical protein